MTGLLDLLAGLPPGSDGLSIADALGCDLPALLPVLARALDGGSLERWDTDGRTLYLLSSRSLEALGLVLDSEGEIWVWRPVGDPPRPIRSRAADTDALVGGQLAFSISGESSPQLDPLDQAIANELAERQAARFAADAAAGRRVTGDRPLPAPSRLLGSTAVWVGEHVGPCPVCRGRALAASECCLKCLRWGLDHLAPKVPRSERPKPPGFRPKAGKRKAVAA